MLFPLVTLGMSQLLHLEAASLKGSAVGASWALLTLGSLAFLNEPPFWNFSLLGLFLGLKTLLGTVYCYVSCKKKWVDAGILSWAQLSYYLLLVWCYWRTRRGTR